MFPNYNGIKIDFWKKKDLWDFPNILTVNNRDLNNSWVKNKTHGNSEVFWFDDNKETIYWDLCRCRALKCQYRKGLKSRAPIHTSGEENKDKK